MVRFVSNYRMPMIHTSVVDRTNGVRGVQTSNFFGLFSRQSLPEDAIGTVTLAFSGAKLGSEIKIFSDEGVLLAGTESSVALPSFQLQRFAPGSPKNVVRILIIALAYEVVDFTIELVSSTTIPVFQRVDRNYRNPV